MGHGTIVGTAYSALPGRTLVETWLSQSHRM